MADEPTGGTSLDSEVITGLTPAEVAERTGLSIEALRYYERIGLLGTVPRNSGGRRVYTEGNISWIGLLTCMRSAGMGIADLQRFVEVLRGEAASDVGPVELLEAHRATLRAHVDQMHVALAVLEDKIDHYRRTAT